MLNLHPEVLRKNGKEEFVVLPYEEYLALQEFLAEVEDLLVLREAKQEEAQEPTVSLAEVKQRLGLGN
jgi:hypothetical protein